MSRQEPGGAVRVDARSGAGSGERARSFLRVDELRRDRRVGRGAGRARKTAGSRRVDARRRARARGDRPAGPPDRGQPPADRGRTVRFTIAPPKDVNFISSIGDSPFAVSPDGRHLVFAGVGADGRRGLWLHSFDSLVSRPLPGTEGAIGPFWSPDGLAVGFFTANRLKRVSIAGGDVDHHLRSPLRRRRHVESRRRDLFAPAIDTRSLPGGGNRRHADTGHGVGCGARRRALTWGRCSCRTAVTSCSGLSEATPRAPTWPRSIHLNASACRSDASMLGFSSPDFLFFMRDRTLMAQRLDLKRLD